MGNAIRTKPVRKLLTSYSVLLILLLTGCAFNLLRRVTAPEDLTPAQIEAYNKVGLDVYACFQLSGPPPVGATTLILWPKDRAMSERFGASCQILQR